MLTPSLGFTVLLSACLAECRSVFDVHHVHGHYRRQNEDRNGLFLLANAVQSGSAADGSKNGTSASGQSKSLTSQNNFINFCKGKTLTNGLQVTTGSCNGIPMGDIPSKQNMVSSIITFPVAGSATIQENTTFQITVQMINFVAGSFTNAQETYYSAPQELSDGKIVGHTHVTVQDMGANLNPKQPLNPEAFVFFKGINDDGNGNGLLSANVTGGLPAGNYRVCTLASSSNHQLVLMPVAQRGAQDDCTKFTVVGGGNGNGGNGRGAVEGTSSLAVAADESSTSTLAASTTSILSTTPILSTTQAPFANSSFAGVKTTRGGNRPRPPKTRSTRLITTTRGAANNGNVRSTTTKKGAQKTTTKKAAAQATTKDAAQKTTTKKAAQQTTTQAVNNARPTNGVKANRPTKVQIIKIIHRITIIRTIFKFRDSLGGMPPAVNRNGNRFTMGDKVFADLPSACKAACGEQFKTCTSFKGPGFEVQKCEIQRKQCGKAADVAISQPVQTPEVVTATVTVPAPVAGVSSSSVSLPGSVLAEVTVSSTVVEAAPTASVSASTSVGEIAPIQTAPVVEDDGNKGTSPANTQPALNTLPPAPAACTQIIQTVTVDAPAQTVTASASASAAESTTASESPVATLTSVSASASSTSVTEEAVPTFTRAPFHNSTIPRRRW